MFTRGPRVTAAAVALMSLTLAAAQACTTSSASHPAQAAGELPLIAKPQISPMTNISHGCVGGSSEVEEAFAPPGYVYAEWIGCGGIGFARSTDSGRRFGAAMTVPGSRRFRRGPAGEGAP